MVQDLLSGFLWVAEAATESAIAAVEAALGHDLPRDYLKVLRRHNGGEGWVGDGAYLQLWPVEDLPLNNRTLDVARLVPGAMLIGTDGADDMYGIDVASGTYSALPAIGLRAGSEEHLGASWEEFLDALSKR